MKNRPVAVQAGPSTFLWVCIGFVVPYVAFFIVPTFFGRSAMFRPEPLPWVNPLGSDLRALMELGRLWLYGESPYQGNSLYPPLSNLLFAVLHELQFTVAHTVVMSSTLAMFLVLLLGLPYYYTRGRTVSAPLAFFFATGLTSYGMQFEIERGQFNVLAMGLSILGVWIFHARPRWTMLAYALFSAGVHLKLYPAILVLLLTHDYRDTRGNVRRAVGLAGVNILLLFAGGPQLFADFIVALDTLAFKFGGWVANHGIYSFALFVNETLSRHMEVPSLVVPVTEWALTLYLVACLAVIFTLNRRDNQFGLDPYLLLACAIAAMVIPPISYDYKLSFLAPAMALAVLEFERCAALPLHPRLEGIVMLVLIIAAYSSTLYSYDLKPTSFDNNCPALFVILTCVTAMAVMRSTAVQGALASSVAGGEKLE